MVNEIAKERLARIHNAVSAVFYVENSEPENLIETMDELIGILSTEAPAEIERFGRWFENFLAGSGGEPDTAMPVRSLTEMRAMFATKLERYAERIELRGIEKGIERGRAEEKRDTRPSDEETWYCRGRYRRRNRPFRS